MTFSSIGDLASSMILNQSRTQAKASLMRLSQELASGLTSQPADRLRQDFSGLSDWEQSMSSAAVRQKTLAEGLARAEAKQSVLQGVADTVSDTASEMSVIAPAWQASDMRHASENAKASLDQILGLLNTTSGNQSLFAGADTDGPAMAGISEVLASVKVAIGPATLATDVINALDAWMVDPVTGYEAQAYLGSSDAGPQIRLDQSMLADIPGQANEAAIKDVVRNLLLAGLASDTGLNLPHGTQKVLLQTANQGLRSAEGEVISLQAQVGRAEAQIAEATTRANSQYATAERLKLDALGVDEYETATKLQSAELQLEKIYTLTARSARMSLLEYLR